MAVIFGNSNNNQLRGTVLGDVIFGLAGNDTLYGAYGNDILWGDSGNDRLDGGPGADQMAGGSGSDDYLVDNQGDVVAEQAGAGYDTVFTSLSSYQLPGGVEALTYIGGGNFRGVGNNLDNRIDGGARNDEILAGSGNDVAYGKDGSDKLHGQQGNDTLYGGAGVDTVSGGDGNDTLYGDAGNDRLDGGDGNDVMAGGIGADVFAGGNGDDWLIGGDGGDVLHGGLGADILNGGAGGDDFEFDTPSDSSLNVQDIITSFESGIDALDLWDIDANANQTGNQAFVLSEGPAANSVWQYHDENTGRLMVAGDVNGNGQADFLIQIAQVVGGTELAASDFVL